MGEETGERGKSGSTLTGHLRYFLSFCGEKETQKDYYRMMEIVYRAFKQPNVVATITWLIANVGHRVNCVS